jgi:hypothetical protein
MEAASNFATVRGLKLTKDSGDDLAIFSRAYSDDDELVDSDD